MSTQRGCLTIEMKPGEWFCIVAHDEYDYDFTSGATVYGPEKTADEALDAMSDRESNPGSFDRISHGEVTDEVRTLVENARKPSSRFCY